MFINSYVSVKYNAAMSRKWNLKRGVRQGGILSAFLFCVYMDDVLETVAKFGVGGKLGISTMNIQAYADDLVLLSPSSSGLQKLLERAGELLAEEGLVLNVRKTVNIYCIVFFLFSGVN